MAIKKTQATKVFVNNEHQNQYGGGGVGSPYALKEYELDLDEMTFSCSNEDAEFIFKNNPTAIVMDDVVAIAKEFSDDESKHDYSRGYYFYEYGSDNSIYIYEVGIYFDGEEYDFDVKASDEIGGISQLEITPTNVDIDFVNEEFEAEVSQDDYLAIVDKKPDIIIFNYTLAGVKLYFIKQMLHQAGANDILTYVAVMDNIDGNNGSVFYLQMAFEDGEHEMRGLLKDLCKSGATKKEIDISDNSDNWTQAQMEDVYTNKYDVVEVVSSTYSTIIYKVDDVANNSSMVIYWGFVIQQGLTMFIFAYDSGDDLYSLQTQAVPFLPTADPSTDVGKVVQVDNQGEYELATLSSGTKLYQHSIIFKNNNGSYKRKLTFVSNNNTQLTDWDTLDAFIRNNDIGVFAIELSENTTQYPNLLTSKLGYTDTNKMYKAYFDTTGSKYAKLQFIEYSWDSNNNAWVKGSTTELSVIESDQVEEL